MLNCCVVGAGGFVGAVFGIAAVFLGQYMIKSIILGN